MAPPTLRRIGSLLGGAVRRRLGRLGPADAISDVRQVSPAWLTRVLTRERVLPSGRVARIHRGSFSSLTASLSRLDVRYTGDVGADAPRQLLLKCFVSDIKASGVAGKIRAEGGKREVEFYDRVAGHMSAMPASPVVRCYDARYSPERNVAHVLLEDKSDTHATPPWPLPPEKGQCERAVEALARCHAFWWEDSRLGGEVGVVPGAEVLSALGELEGNLSSFVDFLGDRLSSEARTRYERLFGAILRGPFGRSTMARLAKRRAVTLIHGDGNWWNFLYPRDPEREPVYLIDWQFWRVGVGTDDMVDLLGLHLDPERRHALEEDLLRRYQRALQEAGVAGYGWADCWNDYRESAVRSLTVPLWQWVVGMPVTIWWPNLNRILRACADLGTDELVGGS